MIKLRPALLILLTLLTIAASLSAPVQTQAQLQPRLYLPYISSPKEPSIFGLEVRSLGPERGLDLLTSAGTDWVRRNSLRWAHVEPNRGEGYTWDAPRVQQLEKEMILASERGLNFILVVNGSPTWAVTPYVADCAPINPQFYSDYAKFLTAVVERYSKPPYNVKYWEIGNEPDATIFTSNSGFGCWGDKNDPYYGGEAFGRMMRAVVPAMRRANPSIKILNGGLLLYRPYDPNDPDTRPGRFFEGMLRVGAGEMFDIVSFHTYDYYSVGGVMPFGNRVDWRVGYLRDLLRKYNLPAKPMIRTEAGLLCPSALINSECRWYQADYVARLYVRSLRDDLMASLWYAYDSDSFHNTAMIEPDSPWVPRQTYFAYRHVSTLLSRARYLGPIESLPDSVEGYRLETPKGIVFAFWADNAPTTISLPVRSSKAVCTDRDGGQLPCTISDGQLRITAGVSPSFVLVPNN